MEKYTREEAIRMFVEDLDGEDLVNLLSYINSYDGTFNDEEWFTMDMFDEFMSGKTPLEIATEVTWGEFNPNDGYFRWDGCGNLESGDCGDVYDSALEIRDDMIYHLITSYSGDTPWRELDNMVKSNDDAIFDENYEEVFDCEEDDEE